jgi:hypothetical protein
MRNLKPNHAAVAAKVIDGEAIIMDLTTGAYYSMTGVGAHVWESIERELNDAAILESILARYNVDGSRARRDLDGLITSLVSDHLVIVDDDGVDTTRQAATTGTEAYEAPVLNKYTEMADLLALDPPMPLLAKSPADA